MSYSLAGSNERDYDAIPYQLGQKHSFLEQVMYNQMVMYPRLHTAVIPAAGLGTRFLPITNVIPKELLLVVDRPAIHYVVQEAMAAGVGHVVIVTADGKDSLQEYFTYSSKVDQMLREKGNDVIADELRQFAEHLQFSYVIQKDQRGLGHAVACAKDVVGRHPFAVLLPDDLLVGSTPILAQMLWAWRRNPGNYVAVEEVPLDRISAYGIVELSVEGNVDDRTQRITGLVEKPSLDEARSNLGIVGRYILMPDLFDTLERTSPGAIGEIQLTDGIARDLERHPTYAYKFSGIRYDCGTPIGLLRTSLALAMRREDMHTEVRGWIGKSDL